MADIFATEQDAKNIGGIGTVTANLLLVKNKAASFGCKVKGTYADNQIVCKKDLDVNIAYKWIYKSIWGGNQNYPYMDSSVSGNYFLSTDENYGGVTTYLGQYKYNNTSVTGGSSSSTNQVTGNISRSGSNWWLVIFNTSDTTKYTVYRNGATNGPVWENKYTFSSPLSSKPQISPYHIMYAKGDYLYLLISVKAESDSNGSNYSHYIVKISKTGTSTSTSISLSCSMYYGSQTSASTVSPDLFNYGRSPVNKNGVFMLYSWCGSPCGVKLVDFINARSSSWKTIPSAIYGNNASHDWVTEFLPRWIDDGTTNGSWIVAHPSPFLDGHQCTIYKITNIASNATSFNGSDISSQIKTALGSTVTNIYTCTFIYDSSRSVYYFIGNLEISGEANGYPSIYQFNSSLNSATRKIENLVTAGSAVLPTLTDDLPGNHSFDYPFTYLQAMISPDNRFLIIFQGAALVWAIDIATFTVKAVNRHLEAVTNAYSYYNLVGIIQELYT